MKRVLHISKYYYPFRGGTEQVARDCVNALKDEYEQEVICFSENNKDSVDLVDEIKIIRVGCFAKISSQSISLSYAKQLKKAIEEFNPDTIIFHYPNPFVAQYLIRYIPAACRLVVYWHLDIIRQRFLRLFFDKQNRDLIRRADKIIATSPPYIDGSKYLSSAREKCVVIPNCINEERLAINPEIENRASEIRKDNEGKTICLAVGRHTKYKGFKYLIRAAHLLDDSFQFYLIGKGEETIKLKKEAGDDKKIHFLENVNDEELKAYMLAMDIFCFPSITRNEAFGIALAEAMYYGKPAVTFTIPGSGVNYVCVNDENGIEVSNQDVDAYAEALIRLSEDKEYRQKLGTCGKQRVIELFSGNMFRDNMLENVYYELDNQDDKVASEW